MGRLPSLLESPLPTAEAKAQPSIFHGQLRDLLVCDKPGILKYLSNRSIVEQDISKSSPPRQIAKLSFYPNTLSSLITQDETVLLAAGGLEAEVHISLHGLDSGSPCLWQSDLQLHGSINNSVSLMPHLPLGNLEPRMAVSNNDHTVRFYDVPTRVTSTVSALRHCGILDMDFPVNYCALSPNGQTVLTVGDSNHVSLFKARGSSNLTFESMATFTLPTPSYFTALRQNLDVKAPFQPSDQTSINFPSLGAAHQFTDRPTPTALTASFSAAFSASGMNFAVASQEGLVAVWDVRSSKVLKLLETNPRHPFGDPLDLPTGNGAASGWLTLQDLVYSDPFLWSNGVNAGPPWCVRTVKFGHSPNGKETMAFAEHADFLHVVDARTFEREEIIRVTPPRASASVNSPRTRKSPQSDPATSGRSMAELIYTLERDAADRVLPTVDEDDESPLVLPSTVEEVGQSVYDLVVGSQSSTGIRWTIRDGVLYTRRLSDASLSTDDDDDDEARSDTQVGNEERDAACEPEEGDEMESEDEQAVLHDYLEENISLDTPRSQLGIAGMCFDPSGSRIYVASVEGLAEWKVHGADTRWFGGRHWF